MLADWIRELVDACDLDPAGAGPRLRTVVGSRRARLALDDEVVDVMLSGRAVEVGPPRTSAPVDGTGSTTTETVHALLDGRLELSTALATGMISAIGHRDSVTRLFHAVEIIIDASTRVPALRRLADDFRSGPSRSTISVIAGDDRPDELLLLGRLGLLGERS